jgi:hypothetical protein
MQSAPSGSVDPSFMLARLLYGRTVSAMDRTADNLIDVTWVAWAAERLREQWPRADPTSLEETARDLWQDKQMRARGPRRAAERWLLKEIRSASDSASGCGPGAK